MQTQTQTKLVRSNSNPRNQSHQGPGGDPSGLSVRQPLGVLLEGKIAKTASRARNCVQIAFAVPVSVQGGCSGGRFFADFGLHFEAFSHKSTGGVPRIMVKARITTRKSEGGRLITVPSPFGEISTQDPYGPALFAEGSAFRICECLCIRVGSLSFQPFRSNKGNFAVWDLRGIASLEDVSDILHTYGFLAKANKALRGALRPRFFEPAINRRASIIMEGLREEIEGRALSQSREEQQQTALEQLIQHAWHSVGVCDTDHPATRAWLFHTPKGFPSQEEFEAVRPYLDVLLGGCIERSMSHQFIEGETYALVVSTLYAT